MRLTCLALSIALGVSLSGCGVKLPPRAPEEKLDLPDPYVDCSPYDPDCDKTDESYIPQGR
jgi:hypothetical protein